MTTIPIQEIEESILNRFFANADFENEVINAMFGCMKHKNFVAIREKYGFNQLKDVCLVDYSTGVNDVRVFNVLKAIPRPTDFI